MLKRIYRHWQSLISLAVPDREVEEELRSHLEMQTRDLVRGGLTPEAAKAEAMKRFGDLAAVRQQCVRVRRRGQVAIRAVRWFLILLLLSGFGIILASAERDMRQAGKLMIAIGLLGLVLQAIRMTRPVELPNGGSSFSSTF